MRLLPAAAPGTLAEAVRALDAGDLVVAPSDTHYALLADALDEGAVRRVFEAKRRGADDPVAVAVAGLDEAGHVARLTPLARRLADAFWPGPVALVLPARPWLPDALTAGSDAVAVRAPDAPFVLALARRFGPLVVTTARREGGAAPSEVGEARAQLGADASLYVDAGPAPGAALTVVDATGEEAKVLRAGKVAAGEIAAHGTRAA